MRTTTKKGFASLDKKILKQLSSRAGKIAHKKGVAHEFSFEEAKLAGQKGGRGSLGRKLTKQHRRKISESMKRIYKLRR